MFYAIKVNLRHIVLCLGAMLLVLTQTWAVGYQAMHAEVLSLGRGHSNDFGNQHHSDALKGLPDICSDDPDKNSDALDLPDVIQLNFSGITIAPARFSPIQWVNATPLLLRAVHAQARAPPL
jgi:hypothetical protein